MTIALLTVNAAQAADVFDGSWWSFRCAQMELLVSNSSVNGRYLPPQSQIWIDVKGLRAGKDLIALIATFGADGPLLNWIGQHATGDGENDKIIVRWNMAVDVPDEEED